MLSIVICSVKPDALAALSANIAETVGVPYEIIVVDNSANTYGICTAYNRGGITAKFPFICFIHEDVSFETVGWGQRLCAHLAIKEVGLVGLAGGDTKSNVPSSWSVPVISNEINIVQHYKSDSARTDHLRVSHTARPGDREKVVALDGVLLATRKEVFDEFRFDEKTLPGFHGYDIDYSLQVGTKFELYVAFDIVVHHYSEGSPQRQWVESAIAISRKWKRSLPRSVYSMSPAQHRFHHWHSLRVFMEHLLRLQYSPAVVVQYFLKYSITRYFSPRPFLSVGRFVAAQLVNGYRTNVSPQ